MSRPIIRNLAITHSQPRSRRGTGQCINERLIQAVDGPAAERECVEERWRQRARRLWNGMRVVDGDDDEPFDLREDE